MDMNGCKPLFGHNVVVATTVGKEFVGTLEPIPGSTSSVTLKPLSDDAASSFAFAINGVDALDIGVISFVQDLAQPH
ncbi:MAG: hypothetical protein IAI50_16165 [Candidatus Eremiobacteraeota bacterium]|nr:hypothetical protein [Candidatus Eremiobacteraeota bacterium]